MSALKSGQNRTRKCYLIANDLRRRTELIPFYGVAGQALPYRAQPTVTERQVENGRLKNRPKPATEMLPAVNDLPP